MPEKPAADYAPRLAEELSLPSAKVSAVLRLLGEGNTVPFIARYRKEMTGGLDEVQIRNIEERHGYIIELEERRAAILESIEGQGKLTEELKTRLKACATKAELEDLYLPYKPKRRTRATIAREKGLGPLAERILAQPADGDPAAEAPAFINEEKGVKDAAEALSGARDIVAETVSENAGIRALVRAAFNEEGVIVSLAVPENTVEPTKFQDYYDYSEKISKIPSHRFLALCRGEREKILRVRTEVPEGPLMESMLKMIGHAPGTPFAGQLSDACADSLKRLIFPSVESDVRVDLKMRSDRAAVEIFAQNLRNLLLASPAGGRRVIGVDPGLRTGCKCAAVDETGKFLENITIYISQGDRGLESARTEIASMAARHSPFAFAVGNGTGGRETEKFLRETLREAGLASIAVVPVSEAGASVYSASETAREEFPNLDLTVRGAISIARRLQDPLAELVKVEPKSIGVGQYQHDVYQPLLEKKLDFVVESCVNLVGVELNTASASLLGYVAGIGPTLSRNIVKHRSENGPFPGRRDVLKVAGFGPKTYEQAAGFLRVRNGGNPLDASAVHPERYALVENIAADLGIAVSDLVGNSALADRIDVKRYASANVGEPTLRDIVAELKKPGRDPRAAFEPPRFREDVQTIQDLKPGMELEGVVTNVTAFGAFVDIGVHRDGLVHVSQLADRFVKDASEVVKTGDRIRVRVTEIDLARGRISLSSRSNDRPPAQSSHDRRANEPPVKTQIGKELQPAARTQEGMLSYNPFTALKKG